MRDTEKIWEIWLFAAIFVVFFVLLARSQVSASPVSEVQLLRDSLGQFISHFANH